ncbi:MFS transporter [Umezawaea endophytica]|uniref:MFS transporter n=1 Tax=Umezawaea endophytica TaxID=1654476 RepID=A0A9X2VV21_9PSEU|nr:MFS transporter [Umezawaea endophytica]MCS7483191.1 MFS transporter [Umezawaea endophytica]
MRVYLLSAGIARLADEMVGLALVLFVLARTGNLALAGAVVAAYTVPSIVSGPLLGAWLDRTRRPLVALAGNQFLLAATTVGLLAAVGRSPSVVVLGLAFLAGTTLPMTSGGFTSLLPRLAGGPEDLLRATAADALLFNAAALGGPALTGVLAAVVGGDSAVVAIGVLALVAGLCALALRVPPHQAVEHPPLRQAIREGVRHLATTPPLRGATLTTVLGHGAIGLLATAIPVRATELGHPEGAAGFVWAAMEVGCVVSLLSLRRHLPRWRPEHVVFATVAASGLALATWPLAPDLGVLLGLGLLVGLAQGPTLTSIITARQRYTPPSLLGQVSTTGASLKIGAFAVGAAVGGALHDTSAVFLLAAATQVVATALGLAASAARTAPSASRGGRP